MEKIVAHNYPVVIMSVMQLDYNIKLLQLHLQKVFPDSIFSLIFQLHKKNNVCVSLVCSPQLRRIPSFLSFVFVSFSGEMFFFIPPFSSFQVWLVAKTFLFRHVLPFVWQDP